MIKTTQLTPLPRNIRRLALKKAIHEGKTAFDGGFEKGREAGREEGFQQGTMIAFNHILTAAFHLAYE